MNYAEEAARLRDTEWLAEIADALEDAQRALNHLIGLRECWHECSDYERLEDVEAAIRRLDGTWSGRKVQT
jgi:hypothetical protein